VSGRRIGVNLLWVVPGVVGGTEDYTVRLLESFSRMGDAGLDLTLVVNQAFESAHPQLCERYPIVVAPVSGTSRPVRVVAEATWLAHRARVEQFELVHHMGGTMPLWQSVPGIVTIHDLQPFTHPEYFRWVKRAYLGLTVPRSVRNAVAVVALSEFTRQDVAARMQVDAERILLVPPGVAPLVTTGEEEQARVRRRYGLADRPFFLYPAITYPHKNHVTLVRAFAALAAAEPRSMLVLTGGEGSSEGGVRAEIAAADAAQPGLANRIVRAGRIARSDLDALFDAAVALTCPSHYEGFGIPILEAMNHRLPVLASSVTALPEVVGDGGVLLDPDDVTAWAAAMGRILDDPDHRTLLADRAAERAAEFTWEASARALGAAHHEALDRLDQLDGGTGQRRDGGWP
jgi:glycosyltransferase involved in cell wall biosynthesis